MNRKKPENIQIIGVTGGGDNDSDIERQQAYSQLTMKFEELQNGKKAYMQKSSRSVGQENIGKHGRKI